MPYRRPKPSIVLGAVAVLAVASPCIASMLGSSTSGVRPTNEGGEAAVPTELAEVVLASVPDLVLPLRELTGLDLPDLRLSDLKKLPLPDSIPLPHGLPLPPGLPTELPLPKFPDQPPANIDAPQPNSLLDQLPPDVATQYGATVKELSRDTPFSMIALTARDLAGTDVKVRAKKPDGSWGPWFSTEPIGTRKNDQTTGAKSGTEPIYVGNTTVAQVLVMRKSAAPVPEAPAATGGDRPLGYAPASVSRPMRQDPAPADDLSAVLIEPGESADDADLEEVAQPLRDGGPRVISRAQWGADESIRCQNPEYDDAIGGATVHHTAGNNDYTKADSAGIVRAIYAYHATTLDWCDVGYNALVDRYGQIFEGRAGGLDRPVQGAHAGGFNENTVGVALVGDYEDTAPTDASINAVGTFLGWRLKEAGLDPIGETTMYSEGTEFTPYPEGEAVQLPNIFAHRDVDDTDCPGDAAYAQMDRIRAIAAKAAGVDPAPDVQAAAPETVAPPTESPTPAPAPEATPRVHDLPTELVRAADDNPIAKKWAAEGADQGPLGAALSAIISTVDGRQYAKFANGYIYSGSDGQVFVLVGKILQRFIELGADSGVLGLPLSGEYAVPDGMRADFEKGSLIFNQVTGFVTTIITTYSDAYQDAYDSPADASAPGPVPAG